MKKGILSFLAGALASATVLLGTTAVLAASGVVQFNGVNISMNGQTVFSKEDYLKLDSGEYVPSSILYIDSKNGGTTYLPLAYISNNDKLFFILFFLSIIICSLHFCCYLSGDHKND